METLKNTLVRIAIVLTALSLTACKGTFDAFNEAAANENNQSLGENPPIVDDNPPGNEVDDPTPIPNIPWRKVQHPQASDSDDQISKGCYALGVRDSEQGINKFVVAFEGLASFNQTSANKLYDAFEKNPQMDDKDAPSKSGSGGFMVYYLLWPVFTGAQAMADVMVFPEPSIKTNQKNAKPDICARSWLAGNPQGKLIITGHSYGGHAANQLADVLDQWGVPLHAVVTVDARTKGYVGDLFKTPNAELWLNFYQKNTLFLPGYLVDGADANVNLSSTGTSHGKIPGRPEVQNALLDILLD
ncbi:MAG: hypothetical protein KDD33_10045 [Bdellovibrionales bacterium]|nr:hypothetical protein [Bdellovibrionales bacterium]